MDKDMTDLMIKRVVKFQTHYISEFLVSCYFVA